MGLWLCSFSRNNITGMAGRNRVKKQRKGNVLYPEKEKWSSPGSSVILQHKNTNRYSTMLCTRSLKDVYDSGLQSVVPGPKASTAPANLFEMYILRPLWNLQTLTRSPGIFNARSTWRSTGTWGLCHLQYLPKLVPLAYGPLSQRKQIPGQMAPGDSSSRLEIN